MNARRLYSFQFTSSPTKFAQVKVPIGAVGHADALFLVFVTDFVELNGSGNHIDQQVAGDERDDAGAEFRPADILKFHRVHGVNMANNASNAVFVILNSADEMAMIVFIVI